MKGAMLNYYFMMDCMSYLNDAIKDSLPKDKSIYFNVSNFSSVSSYSFIYNPFKKDKYDLENKIRENYKDFIVEATINLKANMEENDSFFIEGLLLLYGLITTNTLRDYLYPYLKGIKKDDLNLDLALNILDSYIANKKEKIDLTKKSIYSLFPSAYTYYNSFENLIRNPMIRCFLFMGTNSYYIKSYKRFNKFAKNSNKESKLWDYKIFDKLFRGKKKYLIYTHEEDSTLLNLKKETYIINGLEHHHTFDDILKEAKEASLKRINALNSYLFMQKKENDFRIEFNIREDKKL